MRINADGGENLITLKQIAKKAGVSRGTVDRVLHGRGRVAKETAEKVKRIAAELNYSPNVFARHLSMARSFTFGVLIPKVENDSFWAIPKKGVNKAVHELKANGIKAEFFHYDIYSEESFRRVVSKILNFNLDGLLFAPILQEQSKEFISKLPETLPLVFFDSFISECSYISHIGQNERASGEIAGKLMNMLVEKGSEIAVVQVLPENQHTMERIKGFCSFFRNSGGYKLQTFKMEGNATDNDYEEIVQKMRSSMPNLEGIYVCNAYTYKVANALNGNGLNRIKLIGYDLIEENIKHLKEGHIDFLISQCPGVQAYKGIYALYQQVVQKIDVEKEIIIPIDIIIKENVDNYVNIYTIR